MPFVFSVIVVLLGAAFGRLEHLRMRVVRDALAIRGLGNKTHATLTLVQGLVALAALSCVVITLIMSGWKAAVVTLVAFLAVGAWTTGWR